MRILAVTSVSRLALPLAVLALAACSSDDGTMALGSSPRASSSGNTGSASPSDPGTGATSPGTTTSEDAGTSSPTPVLTSDDGGTAIPIEAGPPPAIADDFEATALASRWAVLGAEGFQAPNATTAVVDGARAHRGARSVHVHDGFLQTAPPAAAFYLRVFTWFDADPGTGHWMAWAGVGPGDHGTEVRYGGHYDILQANFFGNDDEVISDPKGYCSPTCSNGVSVPLKTWTCVETYFGKDEIRVWMNDAEIAPLHVTAWRNKAAPWSPVYENVRVGFHDFQGTAIDVWYDDVAIDANRIGCAR